MCWQCPSDPNNEDEVRRIRDASDRFARDLETLARHYRIAARDSGVRHDAKVLEHMRPIARHILRELFEGWF